MNAESAMQSQHGACAYSGFSGAISITETS